MTFEINTYKCIAFGPESFHSPDFQLQKLDVRIIKTIKSGHAMVGAKSPPITSEALLKNIREPQKPIPIIIVNNQYFPVPGVFSFEKLFFLMVSMRK